MGMFCYNCPYPTQPICNECKQWVLDFKVRVKASNHGDIRRRLPMEAKCADEVQLFQAMRQMTSERAKVVEAEFLTADLWYKVSAGQDIRTAGASLLANVHRKSQKCRGVTNGKTPAKGTSLARTANAELRVRLAKLIEELPDIQERMRICYAVSH